MICYTRNSSNEYNIKSERKKKTCFNAHFQYSQSKITRLRALFWCFVNLRMASLDTSFYVLWDSKPGFVLSLFFSFLFFFFLQKSRLKLFLNCSNKKRVLHVLNIKCFKRYVWPRNHLLTTKDIKRCLKSTERH